MSPAMASLNRVLLTGANGFVGSNILKLNLADHPKTHVRAVVRSDAKARQVRSDFPTAGPTRLSFAVVPDITTPGAFDHAFETTSADMPFDAVIHTASPFLYKAIGSNIEFVEPAVKGTTEILKAARTNAPDVKRVVITSSFAAIFDASLPADAARCTRLRTGIR